jgi:hypothetical protein
VIACEDRTQWLVPTVEGWREPAWELLLDNSKS